MEMGNTEFIINCINSGMNRKFPGSFDVSEILKGIGVEIEEGYTNFLRIMEKIIDLNFREKIQLFNTIWNCSCLPSKGPYKIPILVILIQRYETNAIHKGAKKHWDLIRKQVIKNLPSIKISREETQELDNFLERFHTVNKVFETGYTYDGDYKKPICKSYSTWKR